MGGAKILDFVGDSDSKMRQATDQLERVKKRASIVASSVWEWGATKIIGEKGKELSDASNRGISSPSTSGGESRNRDLAFVICSDLKNALASKPSNSSLQAGVKSLLTGGGIRTSASSDYVKWSMQTEKVVRDTLLLFSIYLFYDLDELISKKTLFSRQQSMGGGGSIVSGQGNSSSSSSSSSGGNCEYGANETFSRGDSRSAFDLQEFLLRKQLMHDTTEVQRFLDDFVHSQMFERFCDKRLKKCKAANGSTQFSGGDDQDEYDRVCIELKSKNIVPTVSNVKLIIARISGTNATDDDTSSMRGFEFHDLTMQGQILNIKLFLRLGNRK